MPNATDSRILTDSVALKVAEALVTKAAQRINDSIAYHGSTETARHAIRRCVDALGAISKYRTGTNARDVLMSDMDYSATRPHGFNAAAEPSMAIAIFAIEAAWRVLDC